MENTLPSKTLAPLWILQILQKYSDNEHILQQQDIICKLKEDYSLEIERKTVSRHIANLVSAGYDIIDTRRGYYIVEKQFEDSVLKLLIDSVLYSRQITNKYAEGLISKLVGLGGPSFAEYVKNTPKPNIIEREDNKHLFINVEIINQAINEQKKVSLICKKYGYDKQLHSVWDAPMVLNPLKLVIVKNRYYIIGVWDGGDGTVNLPLDKLIDVKIIEEKIPKSLHNILANEYLDDYLHAHPFMYSGNKKKITLKVSEILFDEIIENFGKRYNILKQDGHTFTITLRANVYDIVDWALQHGGLVEILSPEHARNHMIRYVKRLAEMYLNSGDKEKNKKV